MRDVLSLLPCTQCCGLALPWCAGRGLQNRCCGNACMRAEFVSAMADLADQWGWTGSAVPADSPYVVRQSKNNRCVVHTLWQVVLHSPLQDRHPSTCDSSGQHIKSGMTTSPILHLPSKMRVGVRDSGVLIRCVHLLLQAAAVGGAAAAAGGRVGAGAAPLVPDHRHTGPTPQHNTQQVRMAPGPARVRV